VPGDLPQPAPLGKQLVHHRVVPAGSIGELPVRRGGRLPGQRGLVSAGGPGTWLARAAAVRGDALLDRFREVLPQVEPVGDLDRVGAGSLSVSARALPVEVISKPGDGWSASLPGGRASQPSMRSSGAPVTQSMMTVP
jgi:hypothetical protein